ncbi:hypothetical protein PV10_07867 [Exophiala mesophila]|uniref:DNA polymerase n=1 Tax=Exophiala mesophila TaxID=212818 RepID=A0A0D1XR74_EXOME|nr:uncharacterized protein PV10_07867 [Exophiala mesophila]KIV90581.1 hypothetical protein PV10_07867 [Exophiala mesophila]
MSTIPVTDLSLKSTPPIFILPTHLQTDELHQTEDLIYRFQGTLTYDPHEARLFIGKITQKKRAAFELRSRGIWTYEVPLPHIPSGTVVDSIQPSRKRRKLSTVSDARRSSQRLKLPSSSSSLSSEVEDVVSQAAKASSQVWPDLTEHIIVLKLSWLSACLKQECIVPITPHHVYYAKIIAKPQGEAATKPHSNLDVTYIKATPEHTQSDGASLHSLRNRTVTVSADILERAKADAPAAASQTTPSRRRFGDHKSHVSTSAHPRRPKLTHQTTSESEDQAKNPLPPLPEWAASPNASYACCRSTPLHTVNSAFISQLTKIRDARLLTLDEIGVRAYSTSIASISAYPYRITRVDELKRLPGCERKIASLWAEWHHSAEVDEERHLQAVREIEANEDLRHLSVFWNIWGVGPDTARKFYYDHGWKDLDDIVEYGWGTLNRVQQIGVKYYDDFMKKIPRREVEAIRDIILRHARMALNIKPKDFDTFRDVECVIVGGYRRGKTECGDVDVILAHRDESLTHDLVVEVVRSLETEGWVTHTLSLHTTTSDRGGATLPYRSEGRGHGFDSLDKALCVWQDPNYEGRESGNKNPNIHRRVDIIISGWRTVGCAVLGWSGGTTFQRDIRRFVSKTRGWKFDSSGVRDRGSGHVLDLEKARQVTRDGKTVMDDADTWQDRERRLMEGLGIGYRPATERCTG